MLLRPHLRVFGIWNIRGKIKGDTGYLRKKLLEYRILRSSFKDTGYSQKILKYRMFDGKRCWITKYTLFSAFLLMISINESVKQTVFDFLDQSLG